MAQEVFVEVKHVLRHGQLINVMVDAVLLEVATKLIDDRLTSGGDLLFAQTFVAVGDLIDAGRQSVLVASQAQNLVIVVLVVAMHGSHREVVDATLFEQLLSDQVKVTELLDTIVVQTCLDLIAYTFEVAPTSLN